MTEEHNEEMGKICSHCGEKKPLNEYRKRSGRRTGAHVRRGLCRSCRQRLSAERLAAARVRAADVRGEREGAEQAAVAAEAQTMAAAARRSEPEAVVALQVAQLASAEVAAAAESTKAGFVAELPLSGEPDKKRKRRRRRKKAAGAQPSGSELKLADDVAAQTAVLATSGPDAAESGEKPKRKRKKAKRKSSGQAKAAENLELLVDEGLLADAETDSDAADVADVGMTAEAQEIGEASETAGEPAGKAKRKRKRSKRKGKRSGEDAAALSSEGESGTADGLLTDSGEAVPVSAWAGAMAGVDADPGAAEEQQEPAKKRKRKRKKKSAAAPSPLTAEVASLPVAKVEEKVPPTRKKTAKAKKAAKGQEIPEVKAAAVKEPVKPAAKVAATKPEPVKSKESAAQQASAPAYKPIWPDKGATSANLLSLRSVLQDQDNVVRTAGQARVEEITELVEEPRKSAELIKREADAFHHTPLRNRRPAKHSNALTRREMQSMREAKLTDHRSRFINHAELVERSKRQQAEGKPSGADPTVKPVAGGAAAEGNANAEKDKQSKFEPFDYSVLRPTGKGIIRMRGRTDKGRRWYQEIEYDMAVTLVREQSAVVVNRQTINRLYSNRDFRSYILTRDNYTCYFCGEYGDTIDHLLPRAKGGHSTPLNCVCACNLCNQSKADKDLDVFLKHQKGGAKR